MVKCIATKFLQPECFVFIPIIFFSETYAFNYFYKHWNLIKFSNLESICFFSNEEKIVISLWYDKCLQANNFIEINLLISFKKIQQILNASYCYKKWYFLSGAKEKNNFKILLLN